MNRMVRLDGFNRRGWWALILAMSFAVACGTDPVGPGPGSDAGEDVWEADASGDIADDTSSEDVSSPDADAGEETDTDEDADVDPVDPIDPDTTTIECDRPITPPADGQLCDVSAGTTGYTLIHGTILSGSTVYKEGFLLIDDQRPNATIACVGCDCLEAPEALDATILSCPEGVVSPGLINPHEHITFALSQPRTWELERYDHRHDWRTGARGGSRITNFPSSDSSHNAILYGELRHLVGGATSMAGSGSAPGLMRNLDRAVHTEGLTTIDVEYRTFPLGDSNGTLRSTGCDYPEIDSESRLQAGIYLPHVSEGIDAEARNEFHCLSGASGKNLIQQNTSIIHGIGLTAHDVAMMAQRGAMLVWSPRTNVALYGNTAKAPLFKAFGVPIGLGTDWAASGSMNMLRELQCADYLNTHHFNFAFTDRELWQMATYHAAITMGAAHKLGLLFEGYVADVVIFDGTSREPYRAVIDAGTRDVSLVLRGGEPIYGDSNLIEGLVPDEEIELCEPLDVCSKDRRICLERDAGRTLASIREAIHEQSYPFFFCDEPDDEPSCVPFRPMEYDGLANMTDSDGDGIPDEIDNCPFVFNPIRPMDGGVQADADGDDIGDACDPCPLEGGDGCQGIDPDDWDGDGVPNEADNCPFIFNPDQTDTSEDGIGDACHPCPAHQLQGSDPCPATIYAIKDGTVAEGDRVLIPDALVTASLPGEGVFIQVHPDDEGYQGEDFSGLYIYMRGMAGTPEVGDRIRVIGRKQTFFDQIQLSGVTSFSVLSSDTPLPAPLVVNPADIASQGARRAALEGVLVRVDDVTVTDTNPAAGAGDQQPINEFVVTGGLRINDFFYLVEPFPSQGDHFVSLSGVLRWANGNSKIEPRFADDIIPGLPYLTGFGPPMTYLEAGTTTNPYPGLEVTLNRATDVDLVVDLDYPATSALEGPATVTIPAGERNAPVVLTGLSATTAPVTITARLDGIEYTAEVTVFDDATPRLLEDLILSPSAGYPSDKLLLTARLDVPAGPDGVTIALGATPAASVIMPATLVVPAGATTGSVEIELMATTGTVEIEATLGTSSLTVDLDILDPPVGFVETFERLNLSTTYATGSFVGDNDITWNYVSARLTQQGASSEDYAIENKSILLRNDSYGGSLFAETIPGGIKSFSVEMRKAFTGQSARQVELFINDVSVATSESFGNFSGADDTVYVFMVDDINVSGDFKLEVRNRGAQISLDNLMWTTYLSPDTIPATLAAFSPDVSYLEAGTSAVPHPNLEVILDRPARQDIVVALEYSDATIVDGPDTIVIAAGSDRTALGLTGLAASDVPVTITARYLEESFDATVYVYDDTTTRLLENFEATAATGYFGETIQLTARLNLPAGSEGLDITLSADVPDAVELPETLHIPAGTLEAFVDVILGEEIGLVTIEAEINGASRTTQIDILQSYLETFENLDISASTYTVEGNFTGDNGIQWFFEHVRQTDEDPDATHHAIDGRSLILRGRNTGADPYQALIRSETLPDGISGFSVDMRKAFAGAGARQLELFVNGTSLATSISFGNDSNADDTVYTFAVEDIDVAGPVTIEVHAIGAGQITIDNLFWTPYVP